MVQAGHRERPGSDRLVAERRGCEIRDGDVGQQVRRGDRLGRSLQEAAERRGQREHDGARVDGVDGNLFHDPAPGPV